MPKYISGNNYTALPDGEYPFTVESAILKTSRQLSEMIELQLRIDNHGKDGGLVFDYLVFSEKSAWKIDQFRECIGETILPGEEVEVLPSDLEGATGVCSLRIDIFEGRERNKVESYIKKSEQDDLKMD